MTAGGLRLWTEEERPARESPGPTTLMHQLSFLLAPLIPMVCLALLLWLDRLEESLDSPARRSAPDIAGSD